MIDYKGNFVLHIENEYDEYYINSISRDLKLIDNRFQNIDKYLKAIEYVPDNRKDRVDIIYIFDGFNEIFNEDFDNVIVLSKEQILKMFI